MKTTGYLKNINLDYITRKPEIILQIDADAADIEKLGEKKLSVELKRYREKRSLDANALLWACIRDISQALGADNWEIYLQMLRRYGQFTYILVKENAVDAVKQQWRECEVIGEVDVNGSKSIQLLCYFGSSSYDVKEFSALLDGVISEMKELGLAAPPSGDMERSLERWKELHG